MLEGNLIFVEKIRIVGESAKGPYDFTNIAVSDGFKMVEFGIDNNLAANPILDTLKKGEKINLTVDYKRNRFLAIDLKKIS